MKALGDFCVMVVVLAAYLVLAARDALRERSRQRALGAAYEGPLDGEGGA